MPMNLFLPVAAAGLFMLMSGGAKAKAPAGGASGGGRAPVDPAVVAGFQTRIADAIARGDVNELNRIADQMEKAGLGPEAQSVRTSASLLHNLGVLKPTTGTGPIVPTSPGVPIVPPPSSGVPFPIPVPNIGLPPVVAVPSPVPLPGGVPVTAESQARRATALAMVTNLKNTSKYQESKGLVRAFQEQEGLKADGLYGPKTALQVATYGIVPPRPRYWAKKTAKVDKDTYAAKMVQYSVKDPVQAADWLNASRVDANG